MLEVALWLTFWGGVFCCLLLAGLRGVLCALFALIFCFLVTGNVGEVNYTAVFWFVKGWGFNVSTCFGWGIYCMYFHMSARLLPVGLRWVWFRFA